MISEARLQNKYYYNTVSCFTNSNSLMGERRVGKTAKFDVNEVQESSDHEIKHFRSLNQLSSMLCSRSFSFCIKHCITEVHEI